MDAMGGGASREHGEAGDPGDAVEEARRAETPGRNSASPWPMDDGGRAGASGVRRRCPRADMSSDRSPLPDDPYVLVVDDDLAVARSIRRSIRKIVHAEIAGSIREAEEVIGRLGSPSGAVLDVKLGDDCGFDLLLQLRTLAGDELRALMVTGWDDRDGRVRRRAAEQGADFLHKPWSHRVWQRKIVFLAYGAVAGPVLRDAAAELCREWQLSPCESRIVRKSLELDRKDLLQWLGVTEATLQSHTTSILNKTGARDLAQIHSLLLHSMACAMARLGR